MAKVANDFLLKKWRAMYKGCDIDGNGVITMEDAELFTDRFSAHHKFSAEETAALKEKHRVLWRTFFLPDGQDEVTEEMFIDKVTKAYNADPVTFRANSRAFNVSLTNIFDVNHDGHMSEKELEVCMKSWGLDKFDQKYVKAFPQRQDGFIHNEDYIESWVAYVCNDDENNSIKERPAMYGFGLIDL